MIGIKDMEMPKCCLWDCPLAREDGGACQLVDVRTSEEERPKDCPLVEIGTCKDCKNAIESHYNKCIYCTLLGCNCNNDSYCKDFEKRGGENG